MLQFPRRNNLGGDINAPEIRELRLKRKKKPYLKSTVTYVYSEMRREQIGQESETESGDDSPKRVSGERPAVSLQKN